MSVKRLSPHEVTEILRLGASGSNSSSIAHELDIPRLQVVAILAHSRGTDSQTSETPPSLDIQPPTDLWLETEPPEPLLDEALTGKIEESEDALVYVGEDLEFGTPVYWDPTDSRAVHNPHLMILGESGSGKTYAAQCLIAELAQKDLPTIVFDYGQSFETSGLDPIFAKYCTPQEYLIGEEGLALNPFEIFPQDSRGPNTVATRLSDIFDAAFRLGDIQKKVFIDAALKTYEQAGIVMEHRQTWQVTPPDLTQFGATIEQFAMDREHYPNHRNAAGLSARLTPFFMLVSLRSNTWSWDALVNNGTCRVHMLQFRGLEGKTRKVLVELLLWHMFFHFKASGQNPLRVFCILDEAHHLSFRENGPMEALLRQARKFGLGIIFASQQPEDFSPVAYSNTASKLVFQTTDPTGAVSKFLAAKCHNYHRPDDIHEIITKLEQGQAFFITRNRGHLIQISNLPRRATQWTK